ncbi:hypothetical protein [Roseibium limicola]|uniref:Uncharacterized protein n=1 Tax=Roseibium limicola TaxID=2816037 RepID=A0A939EMJ4_9HYPH|nr:hypothetical protein [Roseibium limicola]MBO0345178.1 hypothetical protein [Roseibium limicola]
MTHSELVTSKIKTYLQELSPQAVRTLVRTLERKRASGSADPYVDLILAASVDLLRTEILAEDEDFVPEDLKMNANGREMVPRLFFNPLEEFLINEKLPEKQEGRVHRPMLSKVWNWISRDLLRNDIEKLIGEIEKGVLSEDRLDDMVRALRRRSVEAMSAALDRGSASEKEYRRLAMEMGGERGLADLRDINKIFAAETWLVPFLNAVPESLSENRLKGDPDILNLVEKAAKRFPDYNSVVAAALLDRADRPSALCSFAGRLARSEDPRVIGQSPYAPFVNMVMSEAERLNILAEAHRSNNPDPVAFSQALQEYHTLVKGVERDMDLSQAGDWRLRLANTKKSISDIVSRELSSAHAVVRRSLQVPGVDATGRFEIDQDVINDAVRALRVVVMVGKASETFAVNDLGKRTRQAVEQTLEILTRSLISELRKQHGRAMEAHMAAVDVAIMLSEIYYGAEYAQQLRRSRHSAVAYAKEHAKASPMPGLSKPKVKELAAG